MTTHNAGAAPEQGNPRGESVPRGNRPAPDLGELRRLLEAATPGPWRVDPGPAHDPTDYVIFGGDPPPNEQWVANLNADPPTNSQWSTAFIEAMTVPPVSGEPRHGPFCSRCGHEPHDERDDPRCPEIVAANWGPDGPAPEHCGCTDVDRLFVRMKRAEAGACQWRDCSCGADRPPVSGEPSAPPTPIGEHWIEGSGPTSLACHCRDWEWEGHGDPAAILLLDPLVHQSWFWHVVGAALGEQGSAE